MQIGILPYLARRALFALALVVLVSSAALILASLAPPDAGFDEHPDAVRARRDRLGLDRPLLAQYTAWLTRTVRLDLGESLRFGRPVRALIAERAGNTATLGLAALALATLLGIPLGIVSGSRDSGVTAVTVKIASAILLAVPPLITSLVLMLVAVRTGWLHTTGLLLPALALALPVAAALERQQSQSMREALTHPSLAAARARGIPHARIVWSHAWRLSLKPVLALYGITVGSVLSGSFAVEIVTGWPGLGALTFEALRSRDVHLAAGCAATGAAFLAAGIFASDVALAAADPRIEQQG